jgi:hypothetical protein
MIVVVPRMSVLGELRCRGVGVAVVIEVSETAN